jgi:hypothetical protein
MSWKSTMRSLAAAQRRVEREAKRRQRELEQQSKELERMEELERARFEIEAYENYLDVLMSIHKECGPIWDWNQVTILSPPTMPERKNVHALKAKKAFDTFKPSISDKLLHRVDSKRESLRKAIDKGIQKDKEEYRAAVKDYEISLSEWREQKDLGVRILAGDSNAYIRAIEVVDPFSELSDLGSRIQFSCDDPKLIEATLFPHGEDVIPKETKSMLKSGRLSVKNMPKTRFYELYQDYVCGCALRVARELFALLPIEMSIITAVSPLLNTNTGHIENQPILSVAIPRKTLGALNFEYLDPSDSLRNFVHNMKFQKTKGFTAVERISPCSIQTS